MAKQPPKMQRTQKPVADNSGIETPPEILAKIEALSDAQKTALVVCAPAFRFGGNWGFLHEESKDFNPYVEVLATERSSIRLSRIGNGGLVEIKESFLSTAVNAVVPNGINNNFVNMAKQRKAEEKEKFDKFIRSVVKGKSRHIQDKGGYYEIVLGIYSVNDTNLIRVGGQDYPAYKLSLIESLEFARQLEQEGFEVYAKAVKPDGQPVFDRVFRLASNSNGQKGLYKGLEIADSDTGIFLTLRVKPLNK